MNKSMFDKNDMPKKITFNDILQNKIKDFVGTKRWSNSQFASR